MIEQACLYKRQNEPDKCNFYFLPSRAQLSSIGELSLITIATKMLDGLENISLRFRKEDSPMSPWAKTLSGASKHFKTPFSVV